MDNEKLIKTAIKMLEQDFQRIIDGNYKKVKMPWYMRWRYKKFRYVRKSPEEMAGLTDGVVINISKPNRYKPKEVSE